MIAKLTGEVSDIGTTSIVLDVQSVGYLVFVTRISDFSLHTNISLNTYLAVRENALDLYGFIEIEEKQMFLHLIKLPKIGPKTALQILSQVDLPTLRRAALTNDPTYLSKMSGIGKKSAEKIVLGLKDMLEENENGTGDDTDTNRGDTDVVEALLTMGYSERDAREAIKKIPKDALGTSERITYALKEVSG